MLAPSHCLSKFSPFFNASLLLISGRWPFRLLRSKALDGIGPAFEVEGAQRTASRDIAPPSMEARHFFAGKTMRKWFRIEFTLIRYRTGDAPSTRGSVISSTDSTGRNDKNTPADFNPSHTRSGDGLKELESGAALPADTDDVCEGSQPMDREPNFSMLRRLLAFVERLGPGGNVPVVPKGGSDDQARWSESSAIEHQCLLKLLRSRCVAACPMVLVNREPKRLGV